MENFSIKVKKTIKRIAAVGATGIMLGATIGGAMAASLGDYPSPFVSGGKFQTVALVIGDASAGTDTLALTDISTKLQATASSQGGSATTTTTTTLTGGKVVEVPLGLGIANTSSAGFDIELKQADISTLRKDVVTFQSDTYNTHDAIVLGRSSPSVATAISEGQKDFGTDVVLKLAQTGVIKYIYAFDTSINMTAATSNDPLDIVFLGKPLKITKIGSATSFTATVGEEHFLNYGESVTVAGHTVKLENIGSSSCVVSVDGGTSTTISTGSTKTIGGIQVKCDSVVSRNTLAESAATLVVGTTATKTYNDQDPYVGEDKINPKWVWSINILGQAAGSKQTTGVSTTTNLPNITGVEFGIKSYYTKQTPSDSPAGIGGCYTLPNNYVSICLDALKVNPSTDYAEYKLEYVSSTDLSRSGLGSRTSAPTVHMIGPTEGFVLNNPSGGKWAANGTSTTDKKTNEIWLYQFGNQNTTGVFYKNTDGYMEYAGNLTTNTTDSGAEFARINYGSIKDTDVRILAFGGATAAQDTYNLTFFPNNGISSSTWSNPGTHSGNITTSWGLTSGDVNRLGFTGTTEEASEVRATNGPSTVQSIGTWDKDVMNSYGIIVKNPKSNGVADRVVLWVPNEQQVAKVRITGTASVGGAAAVVSSTAPASSKASEISDLSAYNAILVGGPCVNRHVATLLGLSYPSCGSDSKFQVGTATIQLVAQSSGKQALIVAGYEADDTRRAGIALKNYDDATIKAALAGKTSVSVTGQTLDLSGIRVA